MCIALAMPKGSQITEKTLHNCWTSNPDGAGFAYVNEEGVIECHKFMSFKSFYAAFSVAHMFYGEISDFLVHFRITSRGATRLDNCHPFQINDKMAFIHNGTISGMPIDTVHQHSDTYLFNELVFKQLPENWEDNAGIRLLIEDSIGWSKIALLHADKGLLIYNEDKGVYDSGIWYSNSTYKDKTWVSTKPTHYDYYKNTGYSDTYADWNYDKESYQEYKERKEIEKATAEKAKVIQIDHKKGKIKEEVDDVDFDDVAFLRCSECWEWSIDTDMYTIEGTLGKVDFVCEDCLILKEENDILYTLVNLSTGELEELKLANMYTMN